jgi:hypothetical protein
VFVAGELDDKGGIDRNKRTVARKEATQSGAQQWFLFPSKMHV